MLSDCPRMGQVINCNTAWQPCFTRSEDQGCQFGHKWDKSGKFSDKIQSESKINTILIERIPDLSPVGQNMTTQM